MNIRAVSPRIGAVSSPCVVSPINRKYRIYSKERRGALLFLGVSDAALNRGRRSSTSCRCRSQDGASIKRRIVVNECGAYSRAALFDIFALICGALSGEALFRVNTVLTIRSQSADFKS